jgi:hypothetical protein
VLRNWREYYHSNPNSKLDRYLGSDTNWRDVLDNAPPNNRVEVLKKLYIRQLQEKLGYTEFDLERIPSRGRPLYYLVFCSRSKLAAKFWHEITEKKPDGQRTFKFRTLD